MTVFQNRLDRLREFLSGSREAVMLTDEVNIGYFTGFFHSEGTLLVTQNSAALLCDFRYDEAARQKAHGCEVVCFQRLSESLLQLLDREQIACVHAEASHLTVSRFSFFKKKLEEKRIDLLADGRLDRHIGELRIVKDDAELDKIASAQRIARPGI